MRRHILAIVTALFALTATAAAQGPTPVPVAASRVLAVGSLEHRNERGQWIGHVSYISASGFDIAARRRNLGDFELIFSFPGGLKQAPVVLVTPRRHATADERVYVAQVTEASADRAIVYLTEVDPSLSGASRVDGNFEFVIIEGGTRKDVTVK
ncbi:hypothetical protein IVA95_29980 [Bradyrhizobium sp. 157]|uniref:hypothetical protein n=1 Tax=Bradyrhizobium sp. 157 TaxID=2782631 RepID=UPI001FF90D6B|nr:hypothetical protein [Bradyrhizobium sp. 157]MCK1641659.1 hypothetical protein [Bradyrhizobium sp. 157]